MCDVRMRVNVDSSRHANALATWIPMGRVEGCDVFIDARLVERMPAHTRLTARGLGPFRRLDLDLIADQEAAALQRAVPMQAEVLPVQCGLRAHARPPQPGVRRRRRGRRIASPYLGPRVAYDQATFG